VLRVVSNAFHTMKRVRLKLLVLAAFLILQSESGSRTKRVGSSGTSKYHSVIWIYRRERFVWSVWGSHFSGDTAGTGCLLSPY
jgi:hypothetical protein